MRKIKELISKNFKLLLRSKFSALIIIFGPILIMLLAGLAFSNTNQYSITVGTYSPEYNELTESFISEMEDAKYTIVKADSEDSCIDSVKKGGYHVCAVFPKGFTIGEEGKNQINFFVDYSKINLVWRVIDSVSGQISERSSELSLNMTTNFLQQIESTETALKGKDALIESLLEKNTEIENDLSEIKIKLNNMNISYNQNDFQTNNLNSYYASVKDALDDTISESYSVTGEINELVTDIEDEVDDMNISSSEKSQILSFTEEINQSLETFGNSISSIDNSSTTMSNQVTTLISEITSNLNKLKDNLNTAVSYRSSIVSRIDSVNEKLSTSRVSLLDLQSTVNNIQEGLSSVSLRDAEDIVSPTDLKVNPVITEETHLNYFFPALLALVVMFVSILLSSNLVMMEKTSNAHQRNHITPTKDSIFLASIYFTCMIIMVLQIFILLFISKLFFNLAVSIISAEFLTLALLTFLVSTAFVFFGMFIGYVFNSRETATLGAISFSTIFFVLSDVIVPIESIPSNLMFLTRFNPFMISSELLRQTILFDKALASLGVNLYLLIAYIVVFLGLTLTSLIHFKKRHFKGKLANKEHELVAKLKKKKSNK